MGTRMLLKKGQLLLNQWQSLRALPANVRPMQRFLFSAQIDCNQPLHLQSVSCTDAVTSEDGGGGSETIAEADPVTEQILKAEDERAIFGVIATSRQELTNIHVSAAIDGLWELQKRKMDSARELNEIVKQPEFSHLCEAVERNFPEFDNESLIKMLYAILRLQRDPSSSTVQQLVMESSRRIPKLEFAELSRFGVCLHDMELFASPVKGQLLRRLQEKLDEMTNIREFSNLMYVLINISSQAFQIKLVNKAMELLNSDDCTPSARDIRRIMRALTFVQICHKPLLQKCAEVLLEMVEDIEADDLCIIYHHHVILGFEHKELKSAILKRFTEIYPGVTCARTLAKIFEILAPEVSSDVKLHLEDMVCDMIPDMPLTSVSRVAHGLRKMNYRSVPILKKVSRHLQEKTAGADVELVTSIAKNLIHLNYRDDKLETLLGKQLVHGLKKCISPHEVSNIVNTLAHLNISHPDNLILNRVENMMHQFNVAEVNRVSMAVTKILQCEQKTQGCRAKYVNLLNKLSRKVVDKLDEIRSIYLFNDVMETVAVEGLDLSLIDELMQHYNKILHKMTPKAAVEVSQIISKMRYLQKPLLDTVAEVVVKQPHSVGFLNIYRILLPFSILNYQPPNSERFLRTCVEKFERSLDRYDPNFLIKIADALALQQKFPSKIIERLFSLEFLTKMDKVLEEMPADQYELCRFKLMQLNRAVRIECPETRIPWFHDDYCEEILKRRSHFSQPKMLLEAQSILSEVVGGAQFMRSWVVTPYYYSIDFECVLDADNTPLVCADYGSFLNKSGKMSSQVLADLMQWGSKKKELPPGAQRVAIDFLAPRHYCVNSRHPLGYTEMKKRHLEIIGYKYVRIPPYEWFSMRLATREDYKNYLREKILGSDDMLPSSKPKKSVLEILSSFKIRS
ncbi:FAST kinase domain-containing protein 1, mitochondrial-like [Ptychodera flava]|uniref:FAST kinase domain-containing protein 1, mitochondrial-like n=1 Tax=Ptychodera flava TaxID=63121 RepID=UPI003969D56D